MARKAAKAAKKQRVVVDAQKQRGRPPLAPKTKAAKWLQDRGKTITSFADELRALAPRLGVNADWVPQTKTLTDAMNARHWPHPVTILLIRHATDGDVDLQDWVRDLA